MLLGMGCLEIFQGRLDVVFRANSISFSVSCIGFSVRTFMWES